MGAPGVKDAGAGGGAGAGQSRAPRCIGLRFSPGALDLRDRVLGVCAAGAPDEARCPGYRLDFAASSLGQAPVCCLACGQPILVSVVKTGGSTAGRGVKAVRGGGGVGFKCMSVGHCGKQGAWRALGG